MPGTPKLIILSDQYRGRTFELTKDMHTVGRVDERDICIKDPTISTYHCRFIRNGNTYIIEDQGSTNGTRVNNVPILSQVLQNSDILQIGGVELLYDCDDKSVTSIIPKIDTHIDLVPTTATQTLNRAKAQGFTERKRGNGGQKLMIGIILILALLVLGLLAFLIFSMQGSGKNAPERKTAAPVVHTVPPAPVPVETAQPVMPPEPSAQALPADAQTPAK